MLRYHSQKRAEADVLKLHKISSFCGPTLRPRATGECSLGVDSDTQIHTHWCSVTPAGSTTSKSPAE